MIAFLLAFSLLQEPVKNDARCMECHVEEAKQWKTSVHARHETGCISCHQKDVVTPAAEKKHAQSKGFISGRNNLSQNVCVQCHVQETAEFKKGPHGDEDINAKAKWTAKTRHG